MVVLGFIMLATFVLPTRAASPGDVAPIPAAARGPAIPQDKGYLVKEIKDGLYWLTDGTYQVMFLTTGRGVIVVDAPPNLAQKYSERVRT